MQLNRPQLIYEKSKERTRTLHTSPCMGTASSRNMDVTCLKPSEYRGDQNTAVAGRIVILKQQEVKPRKAAQAAAAPTSAKGG